MESTFFKPSRNRDRRAFESRRRGFKERKILDDACSLSWTALVWVWRSKLFLLARKYGGRRARIMPHRMPGSKLVRASRRFGSPRRRLGRADNPDNQMDAASNE